ncbi:Cysteine-rich/transmembrane domain A-like protein [Quillaja saponaria]|uniref:Cysteine-rich/transmembrane domain A-like protein n=1 Tax=Quillaja saponaria TaxID=32244 RepID=A0AAD7QIC7_QUISA|nr:Cysteine-rich/transmembrane domain A-like protein [Quillaja saponaria]
MSQYNQHQVPTYPPPVPAGQGYPSGPYITAPPPMGYPTNDDGAGYPKHSAPTETTTRGDGFCKGCFAGLCCCCVLDWCCF